jgi:tRNA modification GTPase
VVDEVLVSHMQSPHTYTREDVAEVNCHGGIVPLRQVLELTLRKGARLALPGELTLRAFLNGRIDLAQAEAVLDIVQARTEAGLSQALGQLEGRLSAQIRSLRGILIDLLAYLEAVIDFSEDDIPPRDMASPLREAHATLERLLAQAQRGIIYRQGLRTAIVGRPNVGKSSLLNALLGVSRAIVTPIPGTTRDTLEETINLEGVPVTLVDTAGIAQSEDPIEVLGIERSRQALEGADLVLMVVDGSEPWTAADAEIAALLDASPALLVVNKNDLPPRLSPEEIPLALPQVKVSALEGEGLDELEGKMLELIFAGEVISSQALLLAHPRHRDVLHRAQGHLEHALESHLSRRPVDCVAIDLTAAVNALGEITGETVTEDLLESIFSQFCLGK